MRISVFTIYLGLAIGFTSCGVSEDTTNNNENTVSVSYQKDIYPIMERSCTPCHFPEEGRKAMLNTYAATKAFGNQILKRIKLDPSAEGYMPFKEKKPALTEQEIQLFENWINQKYPE